LTIANYVTLGRIAAIPLLVLLLLAGLNGLATIFFLVLSFSDWLDGYIARKYKQVSELGKFLDPLADKILVISVLIILVGMGKAGALAVILLTAREFLVQGVRIHAATAGMIIAASPVAKLKTVAQIAATAMLMLNLNGAAAMLWLAVLLSLLSGGVYIWQSKILKP